MVTTTTGLMQVKSATRIITNTNITNLGKQVSIVNCSLFTLISNQKISLNRFLWTNALSQVAVV